MFEFLLSEEKKMRRHAANWLEVAERVFHYRRDQLTDVQRQQLQGATGELKLQLKEKANSAKLKLGIEKLEDVLGKTGGRQYPANSMVENVEFFLVAAIVILGLRAYFVQPFKIPTNSMWPTYYGMTHEIFKSGEEPNFLTRMGRLVAFGATRYEVVAPEDGEVYLGCTNEGYLAAAQVNKRVFLVIPSTQVEYYFSVGDSVVKLDLPLDFNFSKVLADAFGDAMRHPRSSGSKGVNWLSLGRTVKKGEKILSFDILTGDLLFVDRLTYNFFPPKVGQGFVFKTENIHSAEMERPRGTQIKQYYIKRLVGTPGDKLEVHPPVLFRNGSPISGAKAFADNAARIGLYRGYSNAPDSTRIDVTHYLLRGQTLDIPTGLYFAMGDNSLESQDSRYWGFVPEKDVVGRPLFIYYPLTTRWGPAQ